MGKQLVLAEKPSVAREIGKVLGCTRRRQGYLEGDHYIVTWALGHLIELSPPASYEPRWRRWSLSSLPMLPAELTLTVMESTKEQFAVVENLFKRDDIDSLVIATDAGREGELVARWILIKGLWQGQTKRLWISSQTEQAIKEGFDNLKEASLYDSLFEAAQARAQADWYIGMNVSRALTCRYDARLSSGRVQSPTLALITRREEEIEAFSGEFYWTIRADFGLFSATYHDDEGSIRITQEQEALAIANALEGQTGVIVELNKEEKVDPPPLAYNLTELQRDANQELSFSAKETLDTLQQLYEKHKIVTYPRSDSRYITSDIVPTLNRRLQALEATPLGLVANLYLEEGYREELGRFVKESGVTDHHAIIPTEQKVVLERLSPKERALWSLVAQRFMEVLSGDYIYESTAVGVEVGDYRLATHLVVPIKQGWRDMARLVAKKDNELTLEPLELKVGEPLKVVKVNLKKSATKAPERYTEGTLLAAMENAGRFVEDSELKKNLAGGLGTSATRADIIEKLLQNYYIEREGRTLVPTARGREVIRLAPDELCSPELTAKWEERLAKIAEGEEESSAFISDIKASAKKLVKKISDSNAKYNPTFKDGKLCPYCEAAMQKVVDEKGGVHFMCQRLSCGYEEMLVKEVVATKKASVQAKPATFSAPGGKRVVVVKKGGDKVSLPSKVTKTKTVVVRPSNFKRESFNTSSKNPTGSGNTLGELLAANERRHKERDRRKKGGKR
ncbi:MAG: DNA topoisomerase 3 [Sphaerochaetaceae bacterium]